MDREKIIRDLTWLADLDSYPALIAKDALELLKEQEIVRCKDCKKHGDYDCPITSLTLQTTTDDWCCADGVKKEGS